MLSSLHGFMDQGKPIFGMNHGSVGFLMNRFDEEGLVERIADAKMTLLHPLEMDATDADGKSHKALAINEVSLLRMTAQAAKLEISIDGKTRMDELICDGALLATPAAAPPIICQRMGRFCRLMQNCWPSPYLGFSAAALARCALPENAQSDLSRAGGR